MAQSTLARLRSAATSASLPALPTDGRLAALAGLPTLLILRQLLQDLPWWRAVLGWGLMLLVYAPLVRALAGAWRPYQESAEEPGPGLPG